MIQLIPLFAGLGITAGAAVGTAGLITASKAYCELSELSQGLDQLATVLRPDQYPSGSHATEPPRIKCAHVCLMLQEECCFWVQKTGAVQENIEKLREQASRLREKATQEWTAWAGTWSWASWLLE